MLLLDRRLAYEELSRLAVMVGEAFRTHSLFGTVGGLRETGEATNRVLARSALRRAPAIGFIVHTALGIAHRHVPVLLEVRHRAFGRIDRDMGEVRAAQSFDLGIEIRKIAPLQQRVVREIYARRDRKSTRLNSSH